MEALNYPLTLECGTDQDVVVVWSAPDPTGALALVDVTGYDVICELRNTKGLPLLRLTKLAGNILTDTEGQITVRFTATDTAPLARAPSGEWDVMVQSPAGKKKRLVRGIVQFKSGASWA